MDFNLKNNPIIINHLKNISNLFQMKTNEIIIFCPFCDDANRTQNPTHGHCYISINSPVFYCFRCNVSGTLFKLLVYTDFIDIDVLNSIGKYINTSISKNYITTTQQSNINEVRKKIRDLNTIDKDNTNYELFKKYIHNRLGDIDYSYFLLFYHIMETFPCCGIYNSNNVLVQSRFINNNNKRYKKHSNDYYYFQDYYNLEKINNIVLTEGPFDIINLYLYNNLFKHSNTLFLAICGQFFYHAIEKIIINKLLINEYNIHIIFDKQINANYKKDIYHIKTLTKLLNNNINIFGYYPITKDVGIFPQIIKVE